jgi:hypothetical protein
VQLSARFVASLLAHVFGPSFYDDPRFGRGDLGRRDLIDLASRPIPEPWRAVMLGPRPEPWGAVMLNPQPLPPRELYALILADAHIHEFLTLDRIGSLFGEEAAKLAQERALRLMAEIEELCPRLPPPPKGWPPLPQPPWGRGEMTSTELFLFGTRLLAASEQMEQGRLQESLGRLGEKVLGLSQQGGQTG